MYAETQSWSRFRSTEAAPAAPAVPPAARPALWFWDGFAVRRGPGRRQAAAGEARRAVNPRRGFRVGDETLDSDVAAAAASSHAELAGRPER